MGGEQRYRVIVADDDADIRRELVRLLFTDFDLITVQNGRELVERARDCKPDLAIVDISMPEMNGFEAVRRMKSDGIESKVIFLTTNANHLYVQKALDLGAAGYVLKALGAEELPNAVQIVLEGGTFISPRLADI